MQEKFLQGSIWELIDGWQQKTQGGTNNKRGNTEMAQKKLDQCMWKWGNIGLRGVTILIQNQKSI